MDNNGVISSLIGRCTASQDNAALDASFVKTNSGFEVSNITKSGVTLYQYSYSTPPVGATVYKEGARTGKTSGIVTSTNASYYSTIAGFTYTNLLEANYTSDVGDSGGVVYDSLNYVVGIHSAGVANSLPGFRYVTKAS